MKSFNPYNFKPYLLTAIFLILFITGIVAGEYRAVFEKAIKTCLSCIGIG